MVMYTMWFVGVVASRTVYSPLIFSSSTSKIKVDLHSSRHGRIKNSVKFQAHHTVCSLPATCAHANDHWA
jgi:hypothetical protein